MGAFPKDELTRRSSLVALLFRLEQRHSPVGLKDLLDEVVGWFRQHQGYERLQGLFTELIREAFAGHGVKLSGSGNLLEVKTMLATQFEAWREQWLAEARLRVSLRKGRGTDLSPGGEIRRGGAVLAETNPWSQAGIP